MTNFINDAINNNGGNIYVHNPFHLLGGLEGQLNAAGQRVGFLLGKATGMRHRICE